jgi:serine/threonine protein kinase
MYLPSKTYLNKRYVVEDVLGLGGFGITYLATDTLLNVKVAVKEYLPRQLATRLEGHTQVTVYTGEARQHYEYGLAKFLEEAKALAQFAAHPNIVTCNDFFAENGTAYLVMHYIEGITLKEYLARQGDTISFEAAISIMMPVMDALREVHQAHLLHRDISPDNIFLTTTNQVKLIDFGAARYQAGEQSKSLSVILKPGYAPEEQYRSSGKQGPWTDVYAVAATIYRAVTGQNPPEALDRLAEDTMVPPSHLGVKIPPVGETALLRALAVKAGERFQSIGDFQAALSGRGPAVDATVAVPKKRQAQDGGDQAEALPGHRTLRQHSLPWAIAGLMIAGLAVVIAVFGQRNPEQMALKSQTAAPERSRAEPKPVPIQAVAPKLVDTALAESLQELGRKLVRQEKYAEAVAAFTEAVRLKPNHYDSHYFLGLSYNKLGRHQEALKAFQEAIHLKGDEAPVHSHLSWTYLQLGRPEEAVTAGRGAVSLVYQYPEAHYNLGLAYAAGGNRELAIEQYTILKTMDPERAATLQGKLGIASAPPPKPPAPSPVPRVNVMPPVKPAPAAPKPVPMTPQVVQPVAKPQPPAPVAERKVQEAPRPIKTIPEKPVAGPAPKAIVPPPKQW